jgi:hypothetical protein
MGTLARTPAMWQGQEKGAGLRRASYGVLILLMSFSFNAL